MSAVLTVIYHDTAYIADLQRLRLVLGGHQASWALGTVPLLGTHYSSKSHFSACYGGNDVVLSNLQTQGLGCIP